MNRIIVLVAPLIVALGYIALDSDYWIYNFFLKNPKSELIGQFEGSQGDVRRRVNKDLAWIPVRKGDVVQRYDTLFVGEDSKATLQLDIDMKIEVDADSLLNIYGTKEKKGIHLDRGHIKLTSKSGESINITTRDSPNSKIFDVTSKATSIALKEPTGYKNLPIKSKSKNPLLEGKTELVDEKKNSATEVPDSKIKQESKNIIEVAKESKSYTNIFLILIGIYFVIGIVAFIETKVPKNRK